MCENTIFDLINVRSPGIIHTEREKFKAYSIKMEGSFSANKYHYRMPLYGYNEKLKKLKRIHHSSSQYCLRNSRNQQNAETKY